MTIDHNLTVLFTIKDRKEFTFRWMKYANETSFPFKVLIADGGKDTAVAKKLSEYGNFPNINYEYIQYPYDQTYEEYFAKIADLFSKVKTPYMTFVDDDDFILPGGLRSCLEFLIDHPDYVSCGGRIATFSIRPDPNATCGDDVEFILHPPASSIDDPTAQERVERHFKSYNITWYDVHRTEVLGAIYKELSIFNPDNILLAERFASYMTVARGRVKKISSLMLLRQLNILNSSSTCEANMKGDYFDRMFLKTWSRDFNGFIDAVTHAVTQEDGLSGELIRDKLVKGYRRHVSPAIINCLAGEAGVSCDTRFSKIRKIIFNLKDESLVRQMLRKLYHAFQDMVGDKPRPRPITPSSKFYRDIQPVSDFLKSAEKDLGK